MPNSETYRILSLDGGGSWAIIQVKCLRKLFAETFQNADPTGHEVLAQFDLVVANSGGSLVAAAMAENLKLSEIERIFDDEMLRSKVFSTLGFFEKSLLASVARIFKIGAKYATSRKHQALKEILPKVSAMDMTNIPIHIAVDGKVKTQMVIIAYDYYRNRAEMFRTDCDSMGATSAIELKINNLPPQAVSASDCMVSLVDAIHASSTAPVNYFNEPASFLVNNKQKYYWDGGVTGNNNPVLAAVTEAICNRDRLKIEHVQVLSIGTGTVTQLQYDETIAVEFDEFKASHESPGLIKDVQKMGTSILNDPPDTASFIAYMILNTDMPAKPVDFIRLNPNLRPILVDDAARKHWAMPDGISKEEYSALKNMDMDAIKEAEVLLIKKMCDNWMNNMGIPNQAIRADGSLNCLIGHADFNTAMADFKTWFAV